MGQSRWLGAKTRLTLKVVRFVLPALVLAYSTYLSNRGVSMAPWQKSLRKRMAELEAQYSGTIGLFVKDLSTGLQYSHRADENWYIASGVKIPIALEVLQKIDLGSLRLDDELELKESDYVDGAGETNYIPPGRRVTVQYLIEQMLIYSDNTASDLLIHLVGLENVNSLMSRLIPGGFTPITTLGDVRRHAFSEFHKDAFQLPNKEFMALKAITDEPKKIRRLAQILGVSTDEFEGKDLDSAFRSYYSRMLNSASLFSYGRLLELVSEGQLLKETSQEFLMDTLLRVETGKNRVKAGLPAHLSFAHKTGTQYARACDFGIAWDKTNETKRVIIAACSREVASLTEAERSLMEMGNAVYESGVFTQEPNDRIRP